MSSVVARLAFVCSVAVVWAAVGGAVDHHVMEVARLLSPGLEDDAWFDRPSISGDTVVVGAHGDDLEDLDVADAGSAHVFVREGGEWRYQQMLTAPDAGEYDGFGATTAVEGDTIVVGAGGHNGGAGAAYVFVRSAGVWSLEQELQPSDAASGMWFGSTGVAVSGEVVVVGSRWPAEPTSARAYVFRRAGGAWHQEGVLEIPSPPPHRLPGMRAAVSGDTVAISAVVDDHGGHEYAGAVHVFVHGGSGWQLQQTLTAGDAVDQQELGWSLDLEGDTIIAGAHGDDPGGLDRAGAAYVFHREGGVWTEQAKLTSSRPRANDAFGWDVAISGDLAIVATSGSYRTPDPVTSSFHVYSRTGSEWALQRVIHGYDLGVAWIAWEVAVDGCLMVMPAWDPDTEQAAVRVLEARSGPEQVVVPAVARVEGAGAFFTSRWDLYNAGSEDMVIEMTYTPRQDVGGPPQTTVYTLPAGELREIMDPLAEVFGITTDAVGSVTMSVTEGSVFDLEAQSVVFAEQDDGSEFGQLFPAALISDGLPQHRVAHLCTTEDAGRNRVNFGVMAVSDGTRVTLTPVDPVGTALAAARSFDLDAGDNAQVNRVHREFGLGTRSDVLLRLEVESGCALAYASVLDGNGNYPGTSDPTTILPVASGATTVVLLEIGPVQGIDEFSGSGSVVNLSPTPTRVRADFYRRGTSGVAATATIDLEPGETVGYSDLVGEVFGLASAVGTVVLDTEGSGLITAVGREFAVFRGPGGEVVGTAGQLMAGLTLADILWPGITYRFIGLRSIESAGGVERSHVAVFNPGAEPVTATFEMYGADGEPEGTLQRTVEPCRLEHYNSILDLVDPNQDGGVKRVDVTLDGFAWARAFRVNATGDPITLEPFVR